MAEGLKGPEGLRESEAGPGILARALNQRMPCILVQPCQGWPDPETLNNGCSQSQNIPHKQWFPPFAHSNRSVGGKTLLGKKLSDSPHCHFHPPSCQHPSCLLQEGSFLNEAVSPNPSKKSQYLQSTKHSESQKVACISGRAGVCLASLRAADQQQAP